MTSGHSGNDLLRPSLTAADDATGFDRPWSPYHLMWTAFLGGVPAAGYLYAENFRRLGLGRWYAPTIAVSSLLWLLTTGGATYWLLDSEPGTAERTAVRAGLRAVALAGAWVLLRQQRRRWELFTTTPTPAGRLLLPAAVAIAASWLVTLVYGLVIASVFER